MKKRTWSIICLLLMAQMAIGQTDITEYFIQNSGFDESFDYRAGQTNQVAQEILEVKDWTANVSADYTIVGTYEFGFKGTFNTAVVPAKGYDGEAGGGLAVSTGWEQTFVFYQTVTLPAGTYTLRVPTYNGSSSQTAATSQVAWVPTSGTAVRSKVNAYPTLAWTLDQITFTLTKKTTGKIQFGMKAPAGGSGNAAKLVVDYVQLVGDNLTVDKSDLQDAIASATQYYGDGGGHGASDLKSVIDAAQLVMDQADADIIAVLEATQAVNRAIVVYRQQNVSEDNPLDKTEYVVNPSFEKGTNGWMSENLSTQTNTSFTRKAGNTYLEKWTASGSVGDGYVRQTIKNLPNGLYKLVVAAQNLSQSATTRKNAGVYIFAGDQQEPVYTPADYTVKFTSITGETEIGFVAEKAAGNWIAVDNFRLYLIGEVNTAAVLAELQRIVEDAELLQREMMAGSYATTLQSAIDAAKAVTTDTEESTIQQVTRELQSAMAQARISIAQYAALADKLKEVETAYDANKNGADAFKTALDGARLLLTNASATAEELAAEILALDKALLAFNLANATHGSGTAPAVTVTNHYVATGATQALMRATFAGSNILERGVCWSTEHEPTVLDNRSTKYFSLKGYIIHVTGLKPATVYYLRPYVINKSYEVAYGDEVKIVTHAQGTCRGTWNEGAPDEAANARCRKAIQQTIEYFNEWTGIKGFTLTGNYGADTPTADCSYGGWMRIGPNPGNQAIGTVLHETGHGVGVGQHWRWTNCADTRENTTRGKWLGREANRVLHFLENNYNEEQVYFTGDVTHGWGWGSNNGSNISYDWLVNGADKDKHEELQYIGGMCILYGLFIDGLCPTSSDANGISGYTYNFDDSKKYYLMSKDADRGLGTGVLYQRNNSYLGWKHNLMDEQLSDSAAWHLEFHATTGQYLFKNVATGRYLSHSSGITMRNTTNPSSSERFQLMPDRTDVTIGEGSQKLTTHGYWFTYNNSGSKSMNAGAYLNALGYGSVSEVSFNFSNAATAQQWILISEDELETYRQIALATSVHQIETTGASSDGREGVTAIYTPNGMRLQALQRGVNIVRYENGTSRVVIRK